MANAILYNQGSHPTGALKSGTMSMNVSPSLNVGALKWRNGFENNNMWVIYSDTYSQGQATQGNALPTIWATSTFTDAGLVGLINSLPARAGQIPFTNVTAATSWLRGQGVYFLSNQNYPQIVTSGMSMMMDAGFPASFPNGTGTTWYDMSGNDYVGNMVNGPSWTNSGTTSYINFDGTDDYILVSNGADILSKTSYTKIAWFNASTFSTNNNIISGGNVGQHAFWLAGGNKLNAGHNGAWSTVVSTSTLSLNTWYYGVVTFDTTNGWKLYLNGVQESTNAGTSTFTGQGEILIGAYTNAGNLFTGKIADTMVYNRVLSQSEILQNYYNGPIVTSGLTLALDAGNLVSYGGTGNTWKNLTSNTLNGTLTNGPTYNSDSGGCINFDGSDDYVGVTNGYTSVMKGNDYWTVSLWFKANSLGNAPVLISTGVNQLNYFDLFLEVSLNTVYFAAGGGSDANYLTGNPTLTTNTIYNIVFIKTGVSTGNVYLNGTNVSLTINGTGLGAMPNVNADFTIGAFKNGGYTINGNIYNTLMYNRALSANEVQQNYNAQRGRFGI
jgi:hypothetical protein